jgi:hypothetical protein
MDETTKKKYHIMVEITLDNIKDGIFDETDLEVIKLAIEQKQAESEKP